MSDIFYNNIDVFEGLAPTPLFSRTASMLRFGERWGQRHDLRLRGQLTGRCLSYQEWINRQQALLSGFNKDFQTLEIKESGNVIYSYPLVQIKSISFDSSNYGNGFVPFEIELESYPSGYFSGAYGILNPSEEVRFSESDDGQVTIVHKTSAKGFNNSSVNPSNALENARAWAAARTGWHSQILPTFISGLSSGSGLCLRSLAENYDRLNATYEVQETYLADIFGDASQGLLRYTTDFSSGIQDGICFMEVQGQLQGCRYQALEDLRSRYNSFNAFNEALNRFVQITNRSDLNPTPVSKGVNEDSTQRVIGFTYTFNDDVRPRVNIVYEIQFDYDFEADIVSASITATVSSKAAYSSTKWSEILSLAAQVNLYSLIVPSYNTYVQAVAPHLASFPLNPIPLSQSRTDDEFGSRVVLSASYSNAPTPPPGLDSYNSSLTFNPSLHKYAAAPILNGQGEYYIFDLGFASRASLQIDVDGRGADATTPQNALQILKTRVQLLQADYLPGNRKVLESQNYTTGNIGFSKQGSVSATYSAEQAEFLL